VDLNDILRIVDAARQERILRVSAGEVQHRLKFTAPPGIRELQKIQQQLDEIQRAKLLKKKEDEINEKKKKKQQKNQQNNQKGKGKGQNLQKGKGKGPKLNMSPDALPAMAVQPGNVPNPMRMIPLTNPQIKRDRPWGDEEGLPQQKKGKGAPGWQMQNPGMPNFNWAPPGINLEPRPDGPGWPHMHPNQIPKNNNPNFQPNKHKKKWNNNRNNKNNNRDNPNHMPIL